MATVILDTRYNEAKKLLRKLRNQSYAKIIENESADNTVNSVALDKSLKEAKEGKVNKYNSVNDFFEKISW